MEYLASSVMDHSDAFLSSNDSVSPETFQDYLQIQHGVAHRISRCHRQSLRVGTTPVPLKLDVAVLCIIISCGGIAGFKVTDN